MKNERIESFNAELKELLKKYEVALFARPIMTTNDSGLLVQVDSQFQVIDVKKPEAPVADEPKTEVVSE